MRDSLKPASILKPALVILAAVALVAAGVLWGLQIGDHEAQCVVCGGSIAACEATHANCKPELAAIPTDIAGSPVGRSCPSSPLATK